MPDGTIRASPDCSDPAAAVKPMHWKELWEKYSAEEAARMEETPVEELLEDIREGRFGEYYNIWRAVGRRSTLEESGWLLFSILERDIDYLYRYHCAAALLDLAGISSLSPVDLSGNHSEVSGNIETVRKVLEEILGPRP